MALKISDGLDDAAYVLTAAGAYEGFAATHPTIAFYLGMVSAVLFAAANRLSAQGY
jgi:hypothetical protein